MAVSARMPTGDRQDFKRVFADDFGGSKLDTRRWDAYTGQPGGDPGGWWDPSHAVVARGRLNLVTYRDSLFGNRWVSGGVNSAKALRQTYGRYDVRFRLGAGFGVSAVGLLWPTGSVWPPEIDFFEHGGSKTDRARMTATLHHGTDNKRIARRVTRDFTTWHTMGVQWTPGKLVYTLDGHRWATVRDAAVPAQPMYLALQAQAGTCGSEWAPCPDATTPSRVDFEIAWIVAYAYKPGTR
jgi:beta-glucanase (GH16 family)